MNDEQTKPFNVVWVVLLLIIAAMNDLGTLFFTLLSMTGVGITGEAIMVPLNTLLGAFFSAIFFIKMGFGGGSLLALGGSIAEFIIPSRLLTVGGALLMANNPKLKKIGELAAAAETGGASEAAKAGKLAETAQKTEGAVERVERAGSGAENAGGEISRAGEASGGETKVPEQKEAGSPAEAEEKPDALNAGPAKPEGEDIAATEAEQEPGEVLRKKLFEMSEPEAKEELDEEAA